MSPEQILPIVLICVMVVVAVILIMVGIQLFLLLKETRVTMKNVDALVKNTDDKLNNLVMPIKTLGGLASGVAGGMKAFESFSTWLKGRKTDE